MTGRRLPLEPDRGAWLDALARRTVPGELLEPEPRMPGAVRCTACAHRCVLEEGRTGACGVRAFRDGALRVPFGYVARKYVRAVEKNTVYHVRPGAKALTFGMFGCDLRCPYCHNHKVSQALREPTDAGAPIDVSAAALVDEAVAAGCEVVCSAYNEPMITAEWARAVFAEAKRRGLLTVLVTDGHSTPQALAYLRPVTDVFRVDLKGATAEQYKSLGGRLDPVLDSIASARRLGYWVEVVTLVVPGFNDDPRELATTASRLHEIDPAMPWHLDAFVPRYKLGHLRSPSPLGLAMAAAAAYARGRRYVYVGNVGDALPDLSSTRCPGCSATLIERRDWACTRNDAPAGACPRCDARLDGLFAAT